MEEPVIPNSASPASTNHPNLLILISALVALIMGSMGGYLAYPLINKPTPTPTKPLPSLIITDSTLSPQPTLASTITNNSVSPTSTFCNQYGTYTISKNQLLETYTTLVGDSLRSIAKDKLGDQTRALELISSNPSLQRYEVDDVLPARTKIYLPNAKYDDPDVTIYIKAKGNISFNKDKPMFGVNAPNSGTGPFTITPKIKPDLANIKDGDCVEVTYGSRGFDQEKPVFEVVKQN